MQIESRLCACGCGKPTKATFSRGHGPKRRGWGGPHQFWSKVHKDASGCWLWTAGKTTCGYGSIGVGTKVWTAHRLSWELNRSPIPEGLQVLHRCDVPACVNPDHLFLGTQLENIKDRDAKGRTFRGYRSDVGRGSKHAGAKLNEAQVAEIKSLLRSGETRTRIARLFGVVPGTIGMIAVGKNWSHVP